MVFYCPLWTCPFEERTRLSLQEQETDVAPTWLIDGGGGMPILGHVPAVFLWCQVMRTVGPCGEGQEEPVVMGLLRSPVNTSPCLSGYRAYLEARADPIQNSHFSAFSTLAQHNKTD